MAAVQAKILHSGGTLTCVDTHTHTHMYTLARAQAQLAPPIILIHRSPAETYSLLGFFFLF